MIQNVRNSSQFKERLRKILRTTHGTTIRRLPTSIQFVSPEMDLYYAIQHASLKIEGYKRYGRWYLTVTLSDTYDFMQLRFGLTLRQFNFGAAANIWAGRCRS